MFHMWAGMERGGGVGGGELVFQVREGKWRISRGGGGGVLLRGGLGVDEGGL